MLGASPGMPVPPLLRSTMCQPSMVTGANSSLDTMIRAGEKGGPRIRSSSGVLGSLE